MIFNRILISCLIGIILGSGVRAKEWHIETQDLIKSNHQQVLTLVAGKEEAKAEILASFKKAKFNRDPKNVTEE